MSRHVYRLLPFSNAAIVLDHCRTLCQQQHPRAGRLRSLMSALAHWRHRCQVEPIVNATLSTAAELSTSLALCMPAFMKDSLWRCITLRIAEMRCMLTCRV